jgi:(R,R)-butanediol dehydrogenase/meso-butanediol dehydrogenase/diacetyl reductase
MKVAMVHGPGDLRLDTIEMPSAGPNDVLVKVAACGICGSDLTYVKLGGLEGPTGTPMPIGHELSGTIAAVGANVRDLPTGTRVIVNPYLNGIGNGGPEGGFAPYLLVRDVANSPESILRIPDSLSFERAAIAEPLAVALHAVNRGKPRPGQRVVVFGAGPIGLGAVIGLRRRGITDIVSVDLSPFRLNLAKRLGATATINPSETDIETRLAELHGADRLFGVPVVGTDLFIEASGAPSVIPDVVRICRQGARLVVVAMHSKPVEIDFRYVLMKELTIAASIAYPNELPEVLEILATADESIDAYISHRLDFEDFLEAFRVSKNQAEAGKVMITFG